MGARLPTPDAGAHGPHDGGEAPDRDVRLPAHRTCGGRAGRVHAVTEHRPTGRPGATSRSPAAVLQARHHTGVLRPVETDHPAPLLLAGRVGRAGTGRTIRWVRVACAAPAEVRQQPRPGSRVRPSTDGATAAHRRADRTAEVLSEDPVERARSARRSPGVSGGSSRRCSARPTGVPDDDMLLVSGDGRVRPRVRSRTQGAEDYVNAQPERGKDTTCNCCDPPTRR